MPQATQGGGEFRLPRKIATAELFLGALEVTVCVPPLVLCARTLPDRWLWAKVLVPVLLAAWAASLFRLVDLLRWLTEQLAVLQRGEKAKGLNADITRRALARAPRESALVHFALWTGLALVLAGAVFRSGGRDLMEAAALATLGVISAAGVAAVRLLVLDRILGAVRPMLMPQLQAIQAFVTDYRGWFACAVLATLALSHALLAFMAYSLLRLPGLARAAFPLWAVLVVAALVWWRSFVRRAAPIEQYFDATVRARGSKGPARDEPKAIAAFLAAQALPYRLSAWQALSVGLAGAVALTSAWPWPGLHGPAVSRMIVILVLVAGAVAIYQRIALQEILRPLVRHLGSRHLLPPDQVSSPVGLRLKLAVSFVGVWGVGVGFLWLFQQAAPGGSARFALGIGLALAAGLVLLAVRDVVVPLRILEERSAEMSKGQLARPVPPWGEADELGRLAVIFEEMRRSLRDRLRSTESINVDLEREVRRRTEALEQRNAELHDALEKLRRAQDNLVRSEKLASMGRLVAGIAHEINNPVNAVINSLGPLEEAVGRIAAVEPGGPVAKLAAEAAEILAVVQRGAARTKSIVQALHGYARGDESVEREVFLARSVEDTLGLLQHRLRHVQIIKEVEPDARVRGFPGQIDQVLMNLLTNAAQAMGDRGGTIRVSTQSRDGRVLLMVSDDGPGIPADVLPRIFDPFFTTKDVGEGSGLGLSIVHGIIERHGGQIDVDSKPGQGTTFTVSFPRPGG
ncbi:MAG TPA: ATP-binding protein [Polyangia bacterium]|nr:ATP-binding protein [Polyangia bacterium]